MIASRCNADLLSLWERTAGLSPARRSLCLLSELTGDAANAAILPVGERDRRLFLFRKDLFGDRIEAMTECAICPARVELSFSITEVVGDSTLMMNRHRLVSHGYEVDWRLPTAGDVAELSESVEPESVRARLLDRCLLTICCDQQVVAPSQCPDIVIDAVCQAMAIADPLGDIRLELICPECGNGWKAELDIGSYLWKEIDVWARRLLAEIHCLASAYGWSEMDILSMSPRRRRQYLELVAL